MNDSVDAQAKGTVYLVGAGPGDPGLLTRRGAEVLAEADVVVYDRLADQSMLSLAPPDAEMIYVGKQAAVYAVPQDEINRILRDRALEGKRTVRLKGGDPFVFGRGGEEASYLRERGIPFVVVPGISSAVAAPAYAGIPVTDRRCASSFAVITGHEDPSRPESRLDWAGMANWADTLVFLMGLGNLPRIAERLIAAGRPADTPAAVIEKGTVPGQRVVVGRLDDIVERSRAAAVHSPAVAVVGQAVRFRETLAWYGSGPLAGKRILMPRVRRRRSELACSLRAVGGEVTEIPVLWEQVRTPAPDLLERLRTADWILFTSPPAVDALLERLQNLGEDVRRLAGSRLAAMGPATQAHLRRMRLRVDFVCAVSREAPPIPEHFGEGCPSASFVEWPANSDDHLLVVGESDEVERAIAVLAAEGLYGRLGASVDALPVCSSVADARSPLPPLTDYDAIVFAGSGTVRVFFDSYGATPKLHQLVASIGPSTSAEARSLGIRVDIEAEEATAAAMALLIVQRLTAENALDQG